MGLITLLFPLGIGKRHEIPAHTVARVLKLLCPSTASSVERITFQEVAGIRHVGVTFVPTPSYSGDSSISLLALGSGLPYVGYVSETTGLWNITGPEHMKYINKWEATREH
jgi:hypothetical protein